jgi:membrane protein implicated in regulation of membrane protease activity
MNKSRNFPHKKSQHDLSGIASIIAFLIGVLFFLLFGESLFGLKPEPIWIAGLMGLSVSAIVLWVWHETHHKNEHDDKNG